MVVIAGLVPAAACADTIDDDEQVIFFPTAARRSDDGAAWIVPIHGWIFEPEGGDLLRQLAVRGLRKSLETDATPMAREIFEQRVRLFLRDNERGKRIRIRLGDQSFTVGPSTKDGHFTGNVRVSAERIEGIARGGWVAFQAVLAPGDRRRFAGRARLVPPRGISVISDIDDTIKVTEVTDKQQLIANTFQRPFRAVDGMAEAYRRWEQGGADIHFASASPWQLYQPLSELARQAGFPDATFHLRRFRLDAAGLLNFTGDPLEAKVRMIEPFMTSYPQRTFILVGDSGERDPDVYGRLARKYPKNIEHIYIRDVTGQPSDSPRYRRAFRDLPRHRWDVFRDPATLKRLTPTSEQEG
jgi:phosphatidate phosphatase APP1